MFQNIRSYLMRCDVLSRGLFEPGDNFKQNELNLQKEINDLKDDQKVKSDKITAQEKSLLEEKTRRETLEMESRKSLTQLIDKLKSTKTANDDLKEALNKSQMEVLSTMDKAFNRAKDQTLYLYLDLDLSQMDYFKVVQDGRLVDLEEVDKTLSPLPNLEDPSGGKNNTDDNGKENPTV